jgi:hypothetical protein
MEVWDVVEIILNLPRIIKGILQFVVGIFIEIIIWYTKFQIENAFTQVIWEINPLIGIMITIFGLIPIIKGLINIYLALTE